MKQAIYILFICLCILPFAGNDVYAKRKPKAKTSCTISRGKFTASDLLEINYGFKIGENIATIKSTQGASQDVITGIMGGVAVQFLWPKGFVVQPELLYSRKGCMFLGSGLKYNISYVELPVNLMYRLQIAEVKPFIMLAPYGAYAFKLEEDGDMTSDDTYSSLINKWDYGIGLGAGFDVWKIQLSFKYNWGIAQVIDNADKIRNNVFTISAGFLF